MLIFFDKSQSGALPDRLERAGNLLRFAVNRGMASQIKVTSVQSGHIFFSEKMISVCKRIACIVLCIVLAPFCLLGALIGTIAYKLSNSYQNALYLFREHRNMCSEVEKAMKGKNKQITRLQRNFRKVLEKKHIADVEKQKEYQEMCRQSESYFKNKLKDLITAQKVVGGHLVRKRLISPDTMKICREICDAILKRDFATFEIERTYKNGSIVYTSRQCPGVEIREIGDQAEAILHNQEELQQAVATL